MEMCVIGYKMLISFLSSCLGERAIYVVYKILMNLDILNFLNS